MAARERSRYIQTLDLEFQRRIATMEEPLRNCASRVRYEEDSWQLWANDLSQAIEGDIVTAKAAESNPSVPRYYSARYRLGSSSRIEVPNCELPDYSEFVSPTPPNAVDAWGAFRFFAGWLLQSESLPLAVITGMLGVGLLGAAASSFIRQQPKREAGDPFVEDLAGVVIRGFSAAIVIFLAVEGGLNIFGTGTGEPNSYVLLCTCMVGAVFSEDVWKKAHDWFESKKQTEVGNGTPKDSPTGKNGAQEGGNKGLSTAGDKQSGTPDTTIPPGE